MGIKYTKKHAFQEKFNPANFRKTILMIGIQISSEVVRDPGLAHNKAFRDVETLYQT